MSIDASTDCSDMNRKEEISTQTDIEAKPMLQVEACIFGNFEILPDDNAQMNFFDKSQPSSDIKR